MARVVLLGSGGVHEPMTLGVWLGGAGCYFRRLVRRKALSHHCIAILQSVAGLKASPVAPGSYLLAFLSSLNAKFILDEVGGTKERVVWPPGLAAQGFGQSGPAGEARARKPLSMGVWGILPPRDVRAGDTGGCRGFAPSPCAKPPLWLVSNALETLLWPPPRERPAGTALLTPAPLTTSPASTGSTSHPSSLTTWTGCGGCP